MEIVLPEDVQKAIDLFAKVTDAEKAFLFLLRNGNLYTIVQHSGFGYANDPQFEQAVEERNISTKRQFNSVKKQGGIMIGTYRAAYDLCEKINYPPKVKGIIPRAQGTFAKAKIDGLAIYIPGKDNVENPDS